MDSQVIDLDDIQANQEVYSSDGQKLGLVAEIDIDRDTGEQFLEVGDLLRETLYVPKSAIAYAVLGQPVRLKVTAEEAKDRFRNRPNII